MRRENGQAVIFVALSIVLVFGCSAMTVDLGSELAHGVNVQKAADAAALYGVTIGPSENWDVAADVYTFLKDNYNIPSTEVTAVIPNQVDRTVKVAISTPNPFHFAPVIRISKVTISRSAKAQSVAADVFDYTIFSGDRDQPLNLSTNQINIAGNVHSNQDIDLSTHGSENTVGNIEASGTATVSGQCSTNSVSNDARVLSMPDLSGEVLKLGEDPHMCEQVIDGNYTINDTNCNLDDEVLYVKGSLTITTNNISALQDDIIFATQNITISTNNLTTSADFAYSMFYSEKNITVTANNVSGDGIFYAPNGTITFTGNNGTMNTVTMGNGEIVGKDVDLNTNKIDIGSHDNSVYSIIPREAYLDN